ncbi:rhodanese-like domain-containing protein [SAR202 cluster bacterium AC-647-N09_OGT_505m]|nr:rhodanese-like domain-containing protein [SAR202 cluster bacterium AC-647-N09_OGT_505m]
MPERLSLAQAWELAQAGEALIVDVREPSKFALGHPQGALSLQFSPRGLAERVGMLLHGRTPLILVSENADQAEGAASQLKDGGFSVLDVVESSINAWYENGLPMEMFAELSVHEIADAVSGGNTVVLDVRESIEWDMGHVPGAILISLGDLRERIHEVPRESRIVVICEAGVRSCSAASILQAAGFVDVVNVPEGTGGYRNAGLPLQIPDTDPM